MKHPILRIRSFRPGYTLVELAVVIAVIGILAAMVVFAFNGWRVRVATNTLKSDLTNAASQLKSDLNFKSTYPANSDGLPKSQGTSYQYTYNATTQSYCLTATSDTPGVPSFYVSSDNTTSRQGACEGHDESDGTTPDPTYLAASNMSAAADSRHYCAVRKSDKQAYCWSWLTSNIPTKVDGIPGIVTQVSAGRYTSCALTSAKQVYCWGNNSYGQLGDGTTTSTTNSGVKVLGLDGMNVTRVVVRSDSSYTQVCVIADGSLYCWGGASHWKSGTQTVPTKVTGLSADGLITDVDFGYYVACVVGSGQVYCWGATTYSTNAGNLGGSTKTTPVAGLLAGKTATRVSVADSYAQCAVASGQAYCWGTALGFGSSSNGYSHVVDNTMGLVNGTYAVIPVVAGNGALTGMTVTDIAVGNHNVCVIANSKPYCWGSNHSGQIGNSTYETSHAVPGIASATAANVPGGEVFTKISTQKEGSTGREYRSVCALATSSKVYCWGRVMSSIQSSPAAVLAPQ